MKKLFFFLFVIVSFNIYGQSSEAPSKFAVGIKTGPLISKLHLEEVTYNNEQTDNQEMIKKIDLKLKSHFGWGFGLFSDVRLFKTLHYSPEVSFKFWEDEAIFKLANTYATEYNKNAAWYFLPLSFKYATQRQKVINYFFQAGAGIVVLHSSQRSEFNQFESDSLVYKFVSSNEGVSFADRFYSFQPVLFLSPGLTYKINKNLDFICAFDYFYSPEFTSMDISKIPNYDYSVTVFLANSIYNFNLGLKYNFQKKGKYKKKRKR